MEFSSELLIEVLGDASEDSYIYRTRKGDGDPPSPNNDDDAKRHATG